MTGKARRERKLLAPSFCCLFAVLQFIVCAHNLVLYCSCPPLDTAMKRRTRIPLEKRTARKASFDSFFNCFVMFRDWMRRQKENETILNHPRNWKFWNKLQFARSFWRGALKYARARQDKEELSEKLIQTPNQTILLHFRPETEISGCPFVCEQ